MKQCLNDGIHNLDLPIKDIVEIATEETLGITKMSYEEFLQEIEREKRNEW